jgi:hypothetical protein
MVVSRHCLLRRAATEYLWLGLPSSRWKLFLRHMELSHPAEPETIPLIRGCDLSETAGMTHQLEGRGDGAANRGGGTACVEFAESRAARATIGGTAKHQTPT